MVERDEGDIEEIKGIGRDQRENVYRPLDHPVHPLYPCFKEIAECEGPSLDSLGSSLPRATKRSPVR